MRRSFADRAEFMGDRDFADVPVNTLIEAIKVDAEVAYDGTYTVEKNTFTFTVKIGDQEQSQTITVLKLTDKEMQTKNKNDKVVNLTKKK